MSEMRVAFEAVGMVVGYAVIVLFTWGILG